MKIKCPARKVQKSGDSYYIALPPTWRTLHDVKQGQYLIPTINEDGTLSISDKLEEETRC